MQQLLLLLIGLLSLPRLCCPTCRAHRSTETRTAHLMARLLVQAVRLVVLWVSLAQLVSQAQLVSLAPQVALAQLMGCPSSWVGRHSR